MARTKNPGRRAAQATEAERRAVKRTKKMRADFDALHTMPSYIAALPREILGRILALTETPAKYASVCKAWNECLSDIEGSGAWEKVSLYGSKCSTPVVPLHGDHLSSWLRQRVPVIRSMEFVRFNDHPHFLCTALGLLSFAPLKELSFEHCLLNTQVLPALQLVTGITHLTLGSVSPSLGQDSLARALGSLPLLEDLELHSEEVCRSGHLEWAPAVALCTNLTELKVNHVRIVSDCHFPPSLCDLVKLRSLAVAGVLFTLLPASISQLSQLTALSIGVPLSELAFTQQEQLVVPAEAAGLTALKTLALVTTAVPAHLGAFTGLTNLSLGFLLDWQPPTAARLGAAVASMQQLQRLCLHSCVPCTGPQVSHIGVLRDLASVTDKLPNLKELRLTGNRMRALEDGALGQHASRLRSIDLRGNEFQQIPDELQRASGCRHLTLTLAAGSLARAHGGRGNPAGGPLLAMPWLRSLALLQSPWDAEDVEAVLHLRQALDAARRGRGRQVVMTCPPAVRRGVPRPPLPSTVDALTGHVSEYCDEGDMSEEDDYYDGGCGYQREPQQSDGYGYSDYEFDDYNSDGDLVY